MRKPRKSSGQSPDSEQARRQREAAKKFAKGELDWQKAAEKPDVENHTGEPDWHPGTKPQQLREFRAWPIKQVMEVARQARLGSVRQYRQRDVVIPTLISLGGPWDGLPAGVHDATMKETIPPGSSP